MRRLSADEISEVYGGIDAKDPAFGMVFSQINDAVAATVEGTQVGFTPPEMKFVERLRENGWTPAQAINAWIEGNRNRNRGYYS